MSQSKATLRQHVVYHAVRLLEAVLQAMPLPRAQTVGAWLGRWVGRADRKHRKRVCQQLAMAFPALREDEVEALSWRVYEHLGKLGAEILWAPRLLHRIDWRDFLVMSDQLGYPYLYSKRPTIVVSGHVGSWEVAAISAAYNNYNSVTVVKPLPNPLLHRRLEKTRKGMAQVVSQEGAILSLMRVLREGRNTTLLIDQNTTHDPVFVPFFGRRAATLAVPAALALKCNAALVLGFCARLPRGGKFETRIIRVLLPEHYAHLPKEEAVRQLTAECTKVIEEMIRAYPEQWLWTHNRWKTRPVEEGLMIAGPDPVHAEKDK